MGKSTCYWCFMRHRQTLSKGRQLQSTVSAPKGRVTSLVICVMATDVFFSSVLHPFQDYFSSYETGQSVGGAKMGEPPRKTTLACLTCGQCGARTHTRHSGEMIE